MEKLLDAGKTIRLLVLFNSGIMYTAEVSE